MLPRVVWAEESKNGLRFEIGPSYDVVPTRSQLVTHGQSSCTGRPLPIFIAQSQNANDVRPDGATVVIDPSGKSVAEQMLDSVRSVTTYAKNLM